MSVISYSRLPEAMASVAEQVNKEVNRCLEEHTLRRMTSEQEQMLKGQIMAIIAPDNAIFKLMSTYSYSHLNINKALYWKNLLKLYVYVSHLAEF